MTAGPPGQKIIIIAGPNGAGQTTFVRPFLPTEAPLPQSYGMIQALVIAHPYIVTHVQRLFR
jgi:ABC-type Mn2+/Zn2+ transport system ATPase subunit